MFTACSLLLLLFPFPLYLQAHIICFKLVLPLLVRTCSSFLLLCCHCLRCVCLVQKSSLVKESSPCSLCLLLSLLLMLLYWSSPWRDHCSATMKSSNVFVERPLSHAHLYCRLKACRARHQAEMCLTESPTVNVPSCCPSQVPGPAPSPSARAQWPRSPLLWGTRRPTACRRCRWHWCSSSQAMFSRLLDLNRRSKRAVFSAVFICCISFGKGSGLKAMIFFVSEGG